MTQSGNDVQFRQEGKNYSMTIRSVQSSDNGQYHIAATNENGEAVAAFSLLI